MPLIIIVVAFVIVFVFMKSAVKEKNEKIEKNHQEEIKKKFLDDNFDPSIQYHFEYIYPSFNAKMHILDYFADVQNKKIVVLQEHDVPPEQRTICGSNNNTTIRFEEITDCQIKEDSEIMGGVARAFVGGIFAGGAGAIVGSTTAKKHITIYQVLIFTSNIMNPCVTLTLISAKTETNSKNYIEARTFAQNVYASVMAIIANNKK